MKLINESVLSHVDKGEYISKSRGMPTIHDNHYIGYIGDRLK